MLENDLKNQVKTLKVDIEKIEGDLWKIKGVEANALSSYLRTALLQIELGREVKYILDDIISILTNLDEIHDYDYQKLDKVISELKATHSTQKDKIVALYKDKPVYVYPNPITSERFGFGFGGLGFGGKKYTKNPPK
jgi:hypothetical protein